MPCPQLVMQLKRKGVREQEERPNVFLLTLHLFLHQHLMQPIGLFLQLKSPEVSKIQVSSWKASNIFLLGDTQDESTQHPSTKRLSGPLVWEAPTNVSGRNISFLPGRVQGHQTQGPGRSGTFRRQPVFQSPREDKPGSRVLCQFGSSQA